MALPLRSINAPRALHATFTVQPAQARPAPAIAVACCRYCSAALPRARVATYCPHCGQNLTIRHCPACSAELDAGWRFCVACGRTMESG